MAVWNGNLNSTDGRLVHRINWLIFCSIDGLIKDRIFDEVDVLSTIDDCLFFDQLSNIFDNSDVGPDWLDPDPDPQNFINPDPDPVRILVNKITKISKHLSIFKSRKKLNFQPSANISSAPTFFRFSLEKYNFLRKI